MPNPIYLNQKANPWETLLPQLVSSMIQAKIGQTISRENLYDEAILSGKFSDKPTDDLSKPIGLSKNPMYEKQVPVATIGGKKLYKVPTKTEITQKAGRDVLISTGPGGTDYKFLPEKKGWTPGSKEEAIEVAQAKTGPTYSKIEGHVFSKWMLDGKLTPQEKQVVDKKLKETGQNPAQVKENAKARINAKVESFNALMGRPPTANEKRAMIINDPYGILAPDETNNAPQETGTVPTKKPGETVSDYLKRITP